MSQKTDTSTSKKSKPQLGAESKKKGHEFEQEVAKILNLMGCETELNGRESGAEHDIVATLRQGIFKVTILVECKNYAKAVDINDIKLLNGKFQGDRKNYDRAFMVAKNAITADGREWAKAQGIETFTYNELVAKVIDAKEYIEQIIQDFEHFQENKNENIEPMIEIFKRADLYNLYVPLQIDTNSEQGTSVTYRQFASENLEQEHIRKDAAEYVRFWLTKEGEQNQAMAVLGDVGSGKSSFALHLTYTLAKEYHTNPVSARIPIFLSLKDFRKELSIESFITSTLVNRYGIKITNYKVFEALLSLGKILVIVDGFDEMSNVNQESDIAKNVHEIQKLCIGNARVLLTSRTHYFRDEDLVRRTLRQQSVPEYVRQREGVKAFDVVTLAEFTDEQVIQFFAKRLNNNVQKARTIYDKLQEQVHGFEDLAQRPMLLEMMFATSSTLLQSNTPITATQLYKEYVSIWIHQESWRSRMKPDDKALFMEEISFAMCANDTASFSIHWSEIPTHLLGVFGKNIITGQQVDEYVNDVSTCSFLNRDADGNYKFMHKSFMEYFFACAIVREFQKGETTRFAAVFLDREVRKFITEMLRGQEEQVRMRLTELVKNNGERNAQATNALHLLYDLHPDYVQGLDCSGSYFRDLFGIKSLRNANFTSAYIEGGYFWNTDFTNTNFTSARIENIHFQHPVFKNTNFTKTIFENLRFSSISGWEQLSLQRASRLIAVCHHHFEVELWKFLDGHNIEKIWHTEPNLGTIIYSSLSHDATHLYLVNISKASVIETTRGGKVRTIFLPNDKINAAISNIDGTILFVGTQSGRVFALAFDSGEVLYEFQHLRKGTFYHFIGTEWVESHEEQEPAHVRRVQNLVLSNDGQFLLSFAEGNPHLWTIGGKRILDDMRKYVNRGIFGAAFMPNGDILCTTKDGAYCWRKDGETFSRDEGYTEKKYSRSADIIRVHPQGTYILFLATQRSHILGSSIHCCHIQDFSLMLTIKPEQPDSRLWFSDADFSPDGKYIIALCSVAVMFYSIDESSPDFGNLVRVIPLGENCEGMSIVGAKGLDEVGHDLVTDQGTIRKGALQEYFIQLGAKA